MITILTVRLVKELLAVLNAESCREFIEKILAFVETKVLDSSSMVDDRVLLPIIELLRKLIALNED